MRSAPDQHLNCFHTLVLKQALSKPCESGLYIIGIVALRSCFLRSVIFIELEQRRYRNWPGNPSCTSISLSCIQGTFRNHLSGGFRSLRLFCDLTVPVNHVVQHGAKRQAMSACTEQRNRRRKSCTAGVCGISQDPTRDEAYPLPPADQLARSDVR